jgi:SAM-dependent methyltransferase
MSTIDYYNQNAEAFVQGTLNADMGAHYSRFLSYLPSSGRILDLGCGSGRDSRYFMDKGYEVVPVDGSIEVCRLAEEYLGIPVRCLLFQDLAFQKEFDGIWASASLLHVPKNEMPEIMEKVQAALIPGGYLYASFKYGEGENDINGRFFNFYSEVDIRKKLLPQGLKCIEYWISGDVRPGREKEKWLNLIIEKSE